ncbi:hypothetical protein [Pseudoalteromonas gelatinilytica]
MIKQKENIAIILFGNMRTFENCALSLLNSLDRNLYNIDVYIHTWSKKERTTESFYDVNKTNNDNVDVDKIKELYSPRLLVVDEPLQLVAEPCPHTGYDIAGMKSMHYSMSKAINLALSEKDYSAYLLTRPDILFKSHLPMASALEYFSLHDKNLPILFRACYFVPTYQSDIDYFRKAGATDCVMLMNRPAADVLSSINDIPKNIYYEKVRKWAEGQLNLFLAHKIVLVKTMNFTAPLNWSLLRESGEEVKRSVAILQEFKAITCRLKNIFRLVQSNDKL